MDEAKALEPYASTSYDVDDDDDPSRQVIVRGLPDVDLSNNGLFSLMNIFSTFGEDMQILKLGTGFAVLEFSSPEIAHPVVSCSNKVTVDGHVLTLKKKKEHKHFDYITNSCGDEVVNPADLDLSGTFIEQVREITHAICFNKKNVDAFQQIAADVQKIMQQYWPDCEALLYGSMTTGLPTTTSHVDCFLHIPHCEENQVNINVKMFEEKQHIFQNVNSVLNVKGPCVKFYHLPTAVFCLLFKEGYLSVYNSRLVKFLLGANKKFKPAALLIKYWAKVNGLSSPDRVSSYALVILFIFYLQQELGYIPSVHFLQRNSNIEFVIDNWNAGFVHDYQILPIYSDTCELPDILGRFFAFYANFNFKDNMICPFLGHIIPKSHFDNPSQLPSAFDKYKINLERHLVEPLNNKTPIVIQDPLQLNDNLASFITITFAEELQQHFRFAAATYEFEKNNDHKDFLKKILIKDSRVRDYTIKETWENYKEIHCHLESWKSLMIYNFLIILKSTLRIPLDELVANKKEEPLKSDQEWVGTVHKAIWEREINTTNNCNFFDIEREVTDRILSGDSHTFTLEFILSIWHYEDSGTINFDLRYCKGDYIDFMEFGTFFEVQLAQWLRNSADHLYLSY